MEKEELIHLHMLLAQFKKYCEDKGLNCDFSKYNNLHISPLQVHRSKEEHKQAIFLLGTALASMAAMNNHPVNKKPSKKPLQGLRKHGRSP
jgi:hypothetical protein